jgi:tetratricopeptide (TPR) repeat protein
MKKVNCFFLCSCGALLCLTALVFAQQDDFQIYYKARKLLQQREYDKAQEFFMSMQKEYPNSRYIDDAEFWSAYILQKQGKEADAFSAYERLISKNPQSPWADDAETQQIGIAEKFAKKGDQLQIDFIVKKLDSQDKKIKYQAAVSLGKLHDQRALPVLKQMENNGDKDMGKVAKSLIKDFEIKSLDLSPRQRTQPESKKHNGEIPPGQRTIRQPPRDNTITKPNFGKQSPSKNMPAPQINRSSQPPPIKGRMPAGNTKPAAPKTNTQKSSPAKRN